MRSAARPRVTVITSTYNWATVLPYAIGSVLDQTFEDLELLVIGDGCTDESGDVVNAIDDPRVQWHNLAVNSKHQSAPNNEGIRRASGELVAYLGHDDLWLPHHLQVMVDVIDAGAAWATASVLAVPRSGRPVIWPDCLRPQPPPEGVAFRNTPGRFAELSQWVSPLSVVHPRRLAVDLGGWPSLRDTGALAPQTVLWRRMAAVVGPPREVAGRVNGVKIAAAARRGVYRDRPCHEQAYWLERIRASDDPERTLRQATQEDYVFDQPAGSAEMPTNGFRIARARRRVRATLARRGLTSPPRPMSAHEYLREVRRFKGLDD